MKTCRKCGIEKIENEFYKWFKKTGRSGYKKICRSCELTINKDYREKNKIQLLEKRRLREGYKIKTPKAKKIKKLPTKKIYGSLRKDGYRILSMKSHPNSGKSGRLLEHVLIMSEHLRRPLRRGETVHHKNGIRSDNTIENLELWSTNHPSGQRVEDKINWAIDFLKEYGYQVTRSFYG